MIYLQLLRAFWRMFVKVACGESFAVISNDRGDFTITASCYERIQAIRVMIESANQDIE